MIRLTFLSLFFRLPVSVRPCRAPSRAVDWSRCQRGITFLHGYGAARFSAELGIANREVSQLDPRPRKIGRTAGGIASVTEFLGIWRCLFVRAKRISLVSVPSTRAELDFSTRLFFFPSLLAPQKKHVREEGVSLSYISFITFILRETFVSQIRKPRYKRRRQFSVSKNESDRHEKLIVKNSSYIDRVYKKRT